MGGVKSRATATAVQHGNMSMQHQHGNMSMQHQSMYKNFIHLKRMLHFTWRSNNHVGVTRQQALLFLHCHAADDCGALEAGVGGELPDSVGGRSAECQIESGTAQQRRDVISW